MLITALNKSTGSDKDELERWIGLSEFNQAEKISAVTSIYNKIGLPEICQAKINEFYDEGLKLLDEVNVESAFKVNLREFAQKLMNRKL